MVHRHESYSRKRAIPIDISLDNDAYTIVADVPGFELSDISIEADFESLKIEAKRDAGEEETKKNYLHRERFVNEYLRSLKFAKPVNPKEAKVTLKDGILVVYIPLAENSKPVKLVPETN
jgi:HSP20 family protein